MQEVQLKGKPAQEQREILIELVRQGKSDKEIAELCSLSKYQVQHLRYRLGLKKDRGGNLIVDPPPEELVPKPEPVADTAPDPVEHRPRQLPDGLTIQMLGRYPTETIIQRLSGLLEWLKHVDGGLVRIALTIQEEQVATHGKEEQQ